MQAPKFAKGPPLPTDSAPSSVSGWSTAAPAAHSAREMWKQELLHNKIEKARLEEREKAKVLEAKCEELRKQLKAAKKRSRSTDASAAASATTLEDEAPKKKPSPEPKPVGHLVDIMAGTHAGDAEQSDDEVPAPTPKPTPVELGPERATVCQKFQQLNSVVCAYKQKLINPKDPKDVNFTFGVCAEMCEQEVEDMSRWNLADKIRLFPAIISAIHIVYPNKTEEWYLKPWLQDPEGVAEYWRKVLERRAIL